ncbi:AMP-binding protein [Tautonia sociabilis]|uniref:AMP-dependent synthetase n=1 Tax=Tautonia sociabilis TaxID=2080755 RepID=A0A432MQY1_9BACT|nr:AMP-binding protein [Tautonia sociabilis]RUL89368.1 AMP-dependent synthetase [Tautonia sociabilis]
MSVETAARPHGTATVPLPLVPMPALPPSWRSLGRAFITTSRARGGDPAFVDSTGASLSYRQALLKSLALGRVLERVLGPARNVGVLLPPSCAGAVTNIALTLRGRVPVNLNYTSSQESVDSAVDQAGITHILSSRRMLDRIELRPKGEILLLEDLAPLVGATDKIWAAAVALLMPTRLLGSVLPGLRDEDLDSPATIIFTSGSTGQPKGVVLTHRNILSNALQIQHHIHLSPGDVVLGILPFFHSFGFTVPLWTVCCIGLKAVYHPNPLEAQVVARLTREHKASVILATPTFVRGFLKRCKREDFASVRLLVLGAEKLKPELAERIREAWGIEPLEGYGCTETGPVVSVNSPYERKAADGRPVPGNRPGTVGQPMPGTLVKVVDPESGQELPPGREGIICIKGPQVMAGYLNHPEATAQVLRDGWYWTGDLGLVDEDGFIVITDRLNRFSKVAGEMVPHGAVESAILEAAGTSDQVAVVTSLPDSKRGERLVVLYTPELGISPPDLVRKLHQGPLPKLWIPSADDFLPVDEIPVLGTGKLDLRRLKEIARERQPG